MVQTNYIKLILDEHGVTQGELADEWAKTSKSNKYQNNISRLLKESKGIDSISFIKAVSNLTKIKVADLINEISLKDQKILYHLAEPKGEYKKDNVQIPITDIRSAASALMTTYDDSEGIKGSVSVPVNWVGPGIHKIEEVSGEAMSRFHPNDLLVKTKVKKNQWKDLSDTVYEIVNTSGEKTLRKIKFNFEQGFIICIADNSNKNTYPNYKISLNEVSQIWSIRFRINWNFPTPYNAVDNRLKDIEKSQDEINHIITSLYKEMKLLKPDN